MIRLSANILSSSIVLIKRLDKYCFSSLSELLYSSASIINTVDVFSFANDCGWICESNNIPSLTQRGYELLALLNQGNEIALKRQMLSDYVITASPIWSYRILYGRSEATIFMTKDEKACFFEAELLEEHFEPDVIEWWDMLSDAIRMKAGKEKEEIGRMGEKCTIDYERNRTQSEPKWVSVDSNLAGYDVLSRHSKDNSSALLIEVKSSTLSLEAASFHITANEWSVATTSKAYLFYLWCFFENERLLAILSPEEIQQNIPTNNYEGQWESVEIPFSCYKDKFSILS